MTEQLLITPPVCAHTISTSNSRTTPPRASSQWCPLMNSRQSSEPPPTTLGFNLPSPCGTRLSKLGEFLNWGAEKKKLQKNKPKQKTGSQFNLVAQESAAETRTCLVRLFGGSPVQIFKAVGVSQFAQAMSERTHIQHRRARGWFFLKQKKWKPFNETDSFKSRAPLSCDSCVIGRKAEPCFFSTC